MDINALFPGHNDQAFRGSNSNGSLLFRTDFIDYFKTKFLMNACIAETVGVQAIQVVSYDPKVSPIIRVQWKRRDSVGKINKTARYHNVLDSYYVERSYFQL